MCLSSGYSKPELGDAQAMHVELFVESSAWTFLFRKQAVGRTHAHVTRFPPPRARAASVSLCAPFVVVVLVGDDRANLVPVVRASTCVLYP